MTEASLKEVRRLATPKTVPATVMTERELRQEARRAIRRKARDRGHGRVTLEGWLIRVSERGATLIAVGRSSDGTTLTTTVTI